MGNYSRGERIVLCLEPLSSMLKSCSSRYEVVNLQSKWSAPYGAKELHVPAGNKVNEPEFKSNSNFRKNVEGRSTTVQKILNSTEGIKFTLKLFCQTECKKKKNIEGTTMHPSIHRAIFQYYSQQCLELMNWFHFQRHTVSLILRAWAEKIQRRTFICASNMSFFYHF